MYCGQSGYFLNKPCMFNTALIFKYWPFIFECYLSVLAKKVECPKFSLLLIPWIMVSGFVYLKTRALRICMHSLQFKVTQRNCHELHGKFCHTNIHYFGCLHPYLVQTVHHPRKITFSVLYLSNIEPVTWYLTCCSGYHSLTWQCLFFMTQIYAAKLLQINTLC